MTSQLVNFSELFFVQDPESEFFPVNQLIKHSGLTISVTEHFRQTNS